MDIQVFPLVASDTRLDQARAIMKDAARSALVVEAPGRYAFVEAPEIVFAAADETGRTLAPLMDRTPLQLVPPAALTRGPLDFKDQAARDALKMFMDGAGLRFVLLAVTFSRAVVASRHEPDLDDPAAGPVDCYCIADRKRVSPGVPYGDCPAGHKGTVRCV